MDTDRIDRLLTDLDRWIVTLSRQRSVTVDVDGEPVRLCGVPGHLTDEAAAAIADIVRTARVQLAQLPERCRAYEGQRHLPCLREPDHEPPHRTGNGREW